MSRLWQMRRNTSAGAAASNPILAAGEPGFETDTNVFRIGDGVTNYKDLPQYKPETSELIGVRWAYTASSPTLTRINEFDETITAGAAFFAKHPIYSKMRRCNVADDGTINAYHGDAAFAYDGSNGQVMVYVPAFWYRSYKDDQYIRWFISATPRSGFKRHPAFISDSVDKDYFMWGAFEGCAYDTSETAYITDDAAGVDFTATTGDVLSSIAGVKPISGANNSFTRANARILAENRGDGWQLIDFNQLSAIQMLFMVEAGTLNSQSIYEGVTDLALGTGNKSINTGYTAGVGTESSDLGNTSGEVVITTDAATQPFSYHGIENLYGNINAWLDGINTSGYVAFIADHGYVDNVLIDPYASTNVTFPTPNGFITAIGFNDSIDYGFIPSASAGSDSTYLCDQTFTNTGLRTVEWGASWNDESNGGLYKITCVNATTNYYKANGARLAYVPQVA